MYGQREEIQTNPRLCFTDDGAQDPGVAIGRHDGAIGLTGDLAALQNECTVAPLDLLSELLKHLLSYLFLPQASAAALPAAGPLAPPRVRSPIASSVCPPGTAGMASLGGRYR